MCVSCKYSVIDHGTSVLGFCVYATAHVRIQYIVFERPGTVQRECHTDIAVWSRHHERDQDTVATYGGNGIAGYGEFTRSS